jgi:hypothetical protein
LHHTGNSSAAYGLTWLWVSQYLRDGLLYGEVRPESIECITEDQAFSSHMVCSFLTRAPFRQQAGPATHRKTEKERQLLDGREGEGNGEGSKSCDGEKDWSSIIHSIFPG